MDQPRAREGVGKAELLRCLQTGADQLREALARIAEPLFVRPEAIGRWSVRDLLAHLVAHEQRALAEVAAARRRERLAIDHGCTDEFNAGAAFAWAGLGRAAALAAWERSCRQVFVAVSELSETDFAPGSLLEQALGDTVDGALANNTYGHYAEHLPALRAVARLG
jgi:hypothetical protein